MIRGGKSHKILGWIQNRPFPCYPAISRFKAKPCLAFEVNTSKLAWNKLIIISYTATLSLYYFTLRYTPRSFSYSSNLNQFQYIVIYLYYKVVLVSTLALSVQRLGLHQQGIEDSTVLLLQQLQQLPSHNEVTLYTHS